MLTFLIAVLAGLLCGVLSGFGIGGGSLLMVWLTAAQSMEQRTAQGVNLLYFLPTAICSLFFHVKNKQIVWRARHSGGSGRLPHRNSRGVAGVNARYRASSQALRRLSPSRWDQRGVF